MHTSLGKREICSQREEKTGEEIRWEWTDMEIGKNSILWSSWSCVLVSCVIFGD
jgi:hypothetical protein